jgi:uncharacterized repeat protein (TIGR03803 family)
LTKLHNFSFDSSKGKGPVSSLIADEQGALYGTTYEGGANDYGTIFKLTPPASNGAPWTETVLHSFCSQSESEDGSYPTGGLVFGEFGRLYGVTTYGGNACGQSGCGTVFQLTPPASDGAPWTYGVIYSFQPPCGDCINDGTNPTAGLIIDREGVIYGTTNGGGYFGHGTVFEILPDTGNGWKETPIYLFVGGENGDGAYPGGGLTFGADGTLYGTTEKGGANDYGTVFKLTPPGEGQTQWSETMQHSFTGGSDGAYPMAGLVAAYGDFFGTTTYGGANCYTSEACRTVFTLTAETLSTLHSFARDGSVPKSKRDGRYPVGRLTLGEDGALYGTTKNGGSFHQGSCGFLESCGTIFKMTGGGLDWTETVVYRFCDQARYSYFCTTAAYPTAGLFAYQGALYGTTSYQGERATCNCGIVFKLDYGESLRKGRKPKL